jgi:hypothetical protein
MKESLPIPILNLREVTVPIDADLAKIYGVPTKRLNEQVKRNSERFPDDFCFQLTAEEKAKVVANCDHLKSLKFSTALPHAFTEHGALKKLLPLLQAPPEQPKRTIGFKAINDSTE